MVLTPLSCDHAGASKTPPLVKGIAAANRCIIENRW